jgi:hypothetical protein
MRGYISTGAELFGASPYMRITPTRIIWLTNFPVSVNESELVTELKSECSKFGSVESVEIMHVDKQNILVPELQSTLADTELVAIVAFTDLHAAVKCKKYLTGAKCFYLSETAFETRDFGKFENNTQPFEITQEEIKVVPALIPFVKDGQIVSVEKELISTSKQAKRKPKLAPEDLEIID